jgi:hypothetical protein
VTRSAFFCDALVLIVLKKKNSSSVSRIPKLVKSGTGEQISFLLHSDFVQWETDLSLKHCHRRADCCAIPKIVWNKSRAGE